MLKLLRPLPYEIVVATSGGVDSMAVLDFLRRKHRVIVAYYNHATEHGALAQEHVDRYCSTHGLSFVSGLLTQPKPAKLSMEEWWRNSRYEFLESIGQACGPIVTGHNLDDVVETYVWSALHGRPKLIPYSRGRVVRPFLTTRKSEFMDWCVRHDINWIDDHSNNDTRYTRNYIRHQLLPHVAHVNPGIHKTVKRMIDTVMSTCDNTQSNNTQE